METIDPLASFGPLTAHVEKPEAAARGSDTTPHSDRETTFPHQAQGAKPYWKTLPSMVRVHSQMPVVLRRERRMSWSLGT